MTRHFVLWLLAVTCLGAALRLYQLDHGSFWLDELYTVNAAAALDDMHRSKALGYLPTYIALTVSGIEPESIPVSTETWQSMGIIERVVRMPSVIVGSATIVLLGLASVRLLGRRGAVLVALLLAVAPWHIYWSQAARFYVLQFLFYALSLILYYTGTRWQSRPHFVGAMICMVLAFLSQPTALILVGIFGIDWIAAAIRRRPLHMDLQQWSTAIAAVASCAGILAYDIMEAPSNWTQFVDGAATHQSPLGMLMGSSYIIGPVLMTFAAVTVTGLWVTRPRLAVYMGVAAVLPIAVFAAMASWAFVGLRYAFVALYPWLALAAIGCDQLHCVLHRRVGTLLAWSPLLLVLVSLGVTDYSYFNSNGNFHARWREAAAYVAGHMHANETVMASDVHTAAYYLQHPVKQLPDAVAEVRELTSPTWFIVAHTGSQRGSGRHWLLPDAELHEHFGLRTIHASAAVQVYYYAPEEK